MKHAEFKKEMISLMESDLSDDIYVRLISSAEDDITETILCALEWKERSFRGWLKGQETSDLLLELIK